MTPKLTTAITASTAAAMILFAAVTQNFRTLKTTVTWLPTAGDRYSLYYGKAPGNYTTKLDAGTAGTYNFMVVRGTTYYFALTAIRNGTESAKSAEYKYTAPKK